MDLSPNTLSDYIGQERLKTNLRVILASLDRRCITDDPMDHTLLCGPPGLGKTILSEIISREVGRPFIKLMGPQIKDADSLDILTNIRPWTFVFIDEIHALPIKVEEALYEPIDDHKWKGQQINKFTLIGATTKEGLISKPLRSRFTIVEKLTLYSVTDLSKIILRSATIMKLSIDDKAVEAIAVRSRGTPRVANQLLKRISYYSTGYSSIITPEIVGQAMNDMQIDDRGLNELDKRILAGLEKGPQGVDSLSSLLGEDAATIEGRESYLVNEGLLLRTSKGRELTSQGLQYVKVIGEKK